MRPGPGCGSCGAWPTGDLRARPSARRAARRRPRALPRAHAAPARTEPVATGRAARAGVDSRLGRLRRPLLRGVSAIGDATQRRDLGYVRAHAVLALRSAARVGRAPLAARGSRALPRLPVGAPRGGGAARRSGGPGRALPERRARLRSGGGRAVVRVPGEGDLRGRVPLPLARAVGVHRRARRRWTPRRRHDVHARGGPARHGPQGLPGHGRSSVRALGLRDPREVRVAHRLPDRGREAAFNSSPCWQKQPGAQPHLCRLSEAADTPPSALRRGLVARGAAPAMADDLLEWLGADVRFLLPAPRTA